MEYVNHDDLKRTFHIYLHNCDEDELSYDVIEEILQDAINDSDCKEIEFRRVKIHPNKIKEDDVIEAKFPNGTTKRGMAIREVPDIGEPARLFLLENVTVVPMVVPFGGDYILTDGAGFPEGTIFYKIKQIVRK